MAGRWRRIALLVAGAALGVILVAGSASATVARSTGVASVKAGATLEIYGLGRRFSGTFSSPRSTEQVIAVISHNGAILMADDEGYAQGTILAPDRIELCYLFVSKEARVASCHAVVGGRGQGGARGSATPLAAV